LPPEYNYDSIPPYWKVMLQKVPPSKGTPTIQNVHISHIAGTNCKTAINAIGMNTSPLKNFELKDITISANTAGKIEHAKDWHFDNVHISAKDNSKVEIEDAVNVKL
jgi:pectate lyase